MSDDFPTADDLMKQWAKEPTEKPPEPAEKPKPGVAPGSGAGRPQLNAAQTKAINLIMSGLPFVTVAIRPTSETGHDFFVSIDGNHDVLRLAQSELPRVIDRAFAREGIV